MAVTVGRHPSVASGRSRRRANRVDERTAAAVAVAGGVGAALAGAAPTGRPAVDAVLVGVAVAVVVDAAASAAWWVTVVAAGGALAVAGGEPVLTVLALAAFATGVLVGTRRRSMPLARAASVALSCNVLARGDLRWMFGLSAIVGIGVGAFVLVAGLRRRPARVRRVAWWALGSLAALAALAVAGFAIGAAGARRDLEAGRRQVEAAIDALEAGDVTTATQRFAVAAGELGAARERLAGPLGAAASVVPVLSQHRAVALDVSVAGATATDRIATALDGVDLAALRVSGGAIDLDAVAALGVPFAEIDEALRGLSATLAADRSPWVVGAVATALADLRARVDRAGPQLHQARWALALAPAMLGGDAPRHYLVLFTTPAEARGLGGFIGNYAELTFDRGRVAMTAFGRVSDLERQAREIGARVTGPAGFMDRYGVFGYDEDGAGLVGAAPFRNVTMTPHFPWVGAVTADLYGQVTGVTPDGVVAMDPYTIAALLRYTGAVELPTLARTLTPDSAADFLLRDQYVVAGRADRADALEDAARATIDALLTSSLPDPLALVEDLRPMTDGRRLMVWSRDASERDLLHELGLLGEIPALNGANGWSFTATNGGGSKIDSFLERRARYASSTDPATGTTTARLDVELTNTAPAAGLPDYLIGNAVGLPTGTSRLLVSFYSPLAATAITVDGEPVVLSASRELEWNVFTTTVDIAPGATVALSVELSGQLARPEDVVTWTQPLVAPLEVLG